VVDYARNAKDLGTARDGLDVLEAYAGRLSGGEEIKANALLATLYLETGERDKAEKHSQIARAKYQTNVELWDGTISDAMAEMEYSFLSRVYETYMKLHLGQKIDKTVVEKKTKLLQQLETGYQKLVQYKAPEWALSACCRWAEVNKEFARFLIESPLPDLNAEQTEQYKGLLNEKAKPYLNKYEECLSYVKQLARKWAICKGEFIEYYYAGTDRKRTAASYSGKPPIEIGDAFLRDETLLELHQAIRQSPEDIEVTLTLIESYIDRGDYSHAAVIAGKTLGDLDGGAAEIKSRVYNALGVAHLYRGHDEKGKDAFEKALQENAENLEAMINLAGLYTKYAHTERADDLYSKARDFGELADAREFVHSVSRELYDAHFVETSEHL
jgi:hypothetical protein